MIRMLVSWLIITGGILLAAFLLPGIRVQSIGSAFIAAAILAILNLFVKPVLVFLTLPITILTLGLFLIVINALLLMIVGGVVSGFEIKSFWWAVLGSLVISLVSSLTHWARF